MNWQQIAQEYFSFLKQRYRPNTYLAYHNDISQLLPLLMQLPLPEALSHYFASLEQGKPSTFNRKLLAVRSFLTWMKQHGYLTDTDLDGLSLPKLKNTYAQLANVADDEPIDEQRLLEAAQKASLRDRLILMLLLYAGLRPSEITALNLADIDFAENVIRLENGRTISIPAEVFPLLKHYIETTAIQTQDQDSSPGDRTDVPLFITNKGKRMTRALIWQVVRRLADESALVASPRMLRKWFIRRMVGQIRNSREARKHGIGTAYYYVLKRSQSGKN